MDLTASQELSRALRLARGTVLRTRTIHKRGGDGDISKACAYQLDTCRDTDCCCVCHGATETTPQPAVANGERRTGLERGSGRDGGAETHRSAENAETMGAVLRSQGGPVPAGSIYRITETSTEDGTK